MPKVAEYIALPVFLSLFTESLLFSESPVFQLPLLHASKS